MLYFSFKLKEGRNKNSTAYLDSAALKIINLRKLILKYIYILYIYRSFSLIYFMIVILSSKEVKSQDPQNYVGFYTVNEYYTVPTNFLPQELNLYIYFRSKDFSFLTI